MTTSMPSRRQQNVGPRPESQRKPSEGAGDRQRDISEFQALLRSDSSLRNDLIDSLGTNDENISKYFEGKGRRTLFGLMPPQYKRFADYWIDQALYYFRTKPELHSCSLASFVECVLKSAQLALPIDGRMSAAVQRNTKVKQFTASGQPIGERWVSQAQFAPMYLGLLECCRRTNILKHVYAREIREADTFRLWYDRDGEQFEFTPSWDEDSPIIGYFAHLIFHDGVIHVERMSMPEIQQRRDKATTDVIWSAWPVEMAKKTVLRAALKLYIRPSNSALDLMEAVRADDEFQTLIAAKPQRGSANIAASEDQGRFFGDAPHRTISADDFEMTCKAIAEADDMDTASQGVASLQAFQLTEPQHAQLTQVLSAAEARLKNTLQPGRPS